MNPKNALVQLGVRSADGRIDVYRDANVVTLIAHGEATRETDHGKVRTTGVIMQQYDSVEGFEQDRKDLLERFPLAYVAIVNRLGIQDDVRHAPRLPTHLRSLLPKRLPPGMSYDPNDAINEVQTPSNGPIDIMLGVATDAHVTDPIPASDIAPRKKPSILALLTAPQGK